MIETENLVAESFTRICPNCYSTSMPFVDDQRGEKICSSCGLIREEGIIDDEHVGKRYYSAEEASQKARTGSFLSPSIPNIAMANYIDTREPMPLNLRRAVKWNTRMDWSARNIHRANTEIKRLIVNLGLPSYLKEQANHLYRKAFKNDLLRGRSIAAMATACIYVKARHRRLPLTRKILFTEAAVSGHDFNRCLKILISELDVKLPQISPKTLLPRACSQLGLSDVIQGRAQKLIDLWKKYYFSGGKNLAGLAAAALYVAANKSGERLSQRVISNAFEITEATLRSRRGEISRVIKKLQQRSNK